MAQRTMTKPKLRKFTPRCACGKYPLSKEEQAAIKKQLKEQENL